MAKQQVHFNRDTHRFETPQRGAGFFVLRFGLPALLAILLSLGIRFSLGDRIDNPKELNLIAEKEALVEQYAKVEKRITEIETALEKLQQRDDDIYRAYYQMEPLPSSLREAGLGGAAYYSNLQGYESSNLMTILTQRVDMAGVGLDVQANSFNAVLSEAEEHSEQLEHKPSIQPISLSNFYWISSVYGYRTDPMSKRRTMHWGLDFAAQTGLPVYATGDGIVIRTKSARYGFGKEVLVDHGFGYVTRYGHLETIDVKVGEEIGRGHIIGTLGNTGKSTGPHLHYEVRRYGRAQNPKHFYAEDLSAEEYEEIIGQAKPVEN
jgi:murein DD-endopeptidase MepM/ murein hydrolase activator NlpD